MYIRSVSDGCNAGTFEKFNIFTAKARERDLSKITGITAVNLLFMSNGFFFCDVTNVMYL